MAVEPESEIQDLLANLLQPVWEQVGLRWGVEQEDACRDVGTRITEVAGREVDVAIGNHLDNEPHGLPEI